MLELDCKVRRRQGICYCGNFVPSNSDLLCVAQGLADVAVVTTAADCSARARFAGVLDAPTTLGGGCYGFDEGLQVDRPIGVFFIPCSPVLGRKAFEVFRRCLQAWLHGLG
jgi:hypothetical protein